MHFGLVAKQLARPEVKKMLPKRQRRFICVHGVTVHMLHVHATGMKWRYHSGGAVARVTREETLWPHTWHP